MIDTEATVVRLLREAGAVMLAKLTTGELASGDQWFGGRTNSPWDPTEGSSGSSAGPASATAAGCVAFAIGTETSGSILSPSTICGVTGLRPTFGRVSRYGAMTLSWTQDRLGPLCRTVEDCALVFHAIARDRRAGSERDRSAVQLGRRSRRAQAARRLSGGGIPGACRAMRTGSATTRRCSRRCKALGVTPEAFELPAMPVNVTGGILGAESGASFDEFVRSGRDKDLTNKDASNGMRQSRLVPAVEYLQTQRVRAMIMRQFAAAVSKYDVYIAPYIDMRAGAAGRAGGAGEAGRAGGAGEAGRAGSAGRAENAAERHPRSLSGCQPVRLSGGVGAQRVHRRRPADEHHVSRPAVCGGGNARARARVSGARRVSSETSEADMKLPDDSAEAVVAGWLRPAEYDRPEISRDVQRGARVRACDWRRAVADRDLESRCRPRCAGRAAERRRHLREVLGATPGCAVGVATDGTPVFAKGYGHGGSRARRADLARDHLRSRIGVQAVHRRRRHAAGARRQALARRSGSSVHPSCQIPGSTGRPTDNGQGQRRRRERRCVADHPAHAHAHERPARLGQRRRHRRLAADDARLHARARPRYRRPPAGAELHAGTRWSYSNTGFNLAAIIVERVSGRSFQAFTRDRLFHADRDDAHLVA